MSTQWEWSNGQTHSESGEWLKDLVTERGLKALIDQKVEKEMEMTQISNEAKVKTVYQKTLENSAKMYLQEVHEESVLNITLHAEKSKSIGGNSRLDERREMLRLKKLQNGINKKSIVKRLKAYNHFYFIVWENQLLIVKIKFYLFAIA